MISVKGTRMMFLPLLLAAMQVPSAAAGEVHSPTPQPRIVRRVAPRPDVTGTSALIPLDMATIIPTFTAKAGDRTLRLGFDTGAPGPAHLFDRTAKALELAKVGEARAADPSGRNAQTIALYGLPSLTVGGIEIRNWQATGSPAPEKFAALDGIIGLDAFAGYVVTLDYARRQLRIERGALPAANGKTVFDYQEPIPVVPLTIEGKTIDAHVDTGNTVEGIIVPAEFAQSLSGRAKATKIGVAHTVSNAIEMFGFDPAGPVRIGEVVINVAKIAYPSVVPIGNVGSKGLGGMIVRVDPANHRISLERATPLT